MLNTLPINLLPINLLPTLNHSSLNSLGSVEMLGHYGERAGSPPEP